MLMNLERALKLTNVFEDGKIACLKNNGECKHFTTLEELTLFCDLKEMKVLKIQPLFVEGIYSGMKFTVISKKSLNAMQSRKYYAEHPEYRNRDKTPERQAYLKQWREDNKDKLREAQARWRKEHYAEHLEYHKLRQREYRKKYPERVRESNRKYREKQKAKKLQSNMEGAA